MLATVPEHKSSTSAATSPKQRILEAAVSVLAEDGLAGFTHRRIEDRAGVSHGSTTYHFGSRENLFDAVVEDLLQVDAAQIQAAVAEAVGDLVGPVKESASPNPLLGQPLDPGFDWTTPHGIQLLRRVCEGVVRHLMSDRCHLLARYEMYLNAARIPGGRERLTQARQRVYEAQATQAALMGYPDPELFARMIPALIDGCILHLISAPDPVLEHRAADALFLSFWALYTMPNQQLED